jgi:hypothetical protein
MAFSFLVSAKFLGGEVALVGLALTFAVDRPVNPSPAARRSRDRCAKAQTWVAVAGDVVMNGRGTRQLRRRRAAAGDGNTRCRQDAFTTSMMVVSEIGKHRFSSNCVVVVAVMCELVSGLKDSLQEGKEQGIFQRTG